MRPIRRLRSMRVLLALLLLASCSSDPRTLEQDGVLLLVAAPINGGMLAEIVGTVVVVEGRCLGVASDHGGSWPLVWPAGTRFGGGSELTVHAPGGARLRVGDRILTSGGYLESFQGVPALPVVPEECLQDAPGFVWITGRVEK